MEARLGALRGIGCAPVVRQREVGKLGSQRGVLYGAKSASDVNFSAFWLAGRVPDIGESRLVSASDCYQRAAVDSMLKA